MKLHSKVLKRSQRYKCKFLKYIKYAYSPAKLQVSKMMVQPKISVIPPDLEDYDPNDERIRCCVCYEAKYVTCIDNYVQ